MKHIHITLNDEDYSRFKAALPEHGALSRVLRQFIRLYIDYDGDFGLSTSTLVDSDRRRGL